MKLWEITLKPVDSLYYTVNMCTRITFFHFVLVAFGLSIPVSLYFPALMTHL